MQSVDTKELGSGEVKGRYETRPTRTEAEIQKALAEGDFERADEIAFAEAAGIEVAEKKQHDPPGRPKALRAPPAPRKTYLQRDETETTLWLRHSEGLDLAD